MTSILIKRRKIRTETRKEDDHVKMEAEIIELHCHKPRKAWGYKIIIINPVVT